MKKFLVMFLFASALCPVLSAELFANEGMLDQK